MKAESLVAVQCRDSSITIAIRRESNSRASSPRPSKPLPSQLPSAIHNPMELDRNRPTLLSPEAIAHLYDARAGLFDPEEHLADVRRAVAIVTSVCPRPDSLILDLGCGEGQHLIELARIGYRNLHGIDISAQTIEIALRRCRRFSVSVTCSDIADLDAAEFDLVTAFNSSLGSLGPEGDRSYLQGVAKALRPGGLFLLCYLSLDAALRRLGTFYSLSARETGGYVTTQVSISDDKHWMTLHQEYMSERLPSEHIRIFDEQELSEMMQSVGLERAGESVDHWNALPYVGVFLARKPERGL